MGAAPLLDCRARPRGAQLAVIAFAALASGVGAAWLAHAIDSDPQRGWSLAVVAGTLIAALVGGFAMLGARVVVEADGILTYSLHGRANLALDLRDCRAFRPVAGALLGGVGLDVDPGRVRFLHKAGISPERMRRWRGEVGADLVLEGFPPGLAAELSVLRSRLAAGTSPPGV